MQEKETFKMTYSAQQQEQIDEIRKKYLPKQESKLERLRALDASASRKASAGAITLGVLGTLVMGAGMSLCMSELGAGFGKLAMPVGIGAGLFGIALLAGAYPLYQKRLQKEREKIAPEILRLSDELMQ